MLRIKRAYEKPARGDGCRVLVDRLWPRGVTKAAARIDVWRKDLSPSTEPRRWYGHEPAKWDEFRRRYARELKGQGELLDELRARASAGTVTGALDVYFEDTIEILMPNKELLREKAVRTILTESEVAFSRIEKRARYVERR